MFRQTKMAAVAATILLSVLMAGSAYGVIYLDEDFETGKPFANQDFPVIGDKAPAVHPLPMGTNLRAVEYKHINPFVVMQPPIQGTTVTERSFSEGTSYLLASGQALAPIRGQFSANSGRFRFWQFAISTDEASVALTSGTKIGHFRIDYSTDYSYDPVAEVAVHLNLVANGKGGADLVCQNNGSKLGTLTGHKRSWLFVSIIAQQFLSDNGGSASEGWRCYDPLRQRYKGPQPVVADPFSTPDPNASSNFAQISTGIHIYVGSNTPATVLTPAILGHGWGNYSLDSSPNAATTMELGWEFVASNGANLYIDDLYWDSNQHLYIVPTSNGANPAFDLEQGERIQDFTKQIHDPLVILPATDFRASGPKGGPFVSSFKGFALANTGDTTITWSVTDNAAYLGTTPSEGILAPNASTTVTFSIGGEANNYAGGFYAEPLIFLNHNTTISQNRLALLAVVSPPAKPQYRAPANNASAIRKEPTLSWSLSGQLPEFPYRGFGEDARPTCDVYLDTVNPPKTRIAFGLGVSDCAVDLAPNTQYYWYVKAVNDYGEAKGDVWTFTTSSDTTGAENWALY